MPRGKVLEPKILEYLKKRENSVTFKELYSDFPEFSPQGIRNVMSKFTRMGIVEKNLIGYDQWKPRVCFTFRKKIERR